MGSLSVPQLSIRAHQVFHKFNDVLQRLSNPTEVRSGLSKISRDAFEDAYERYKLWAGNLGAFHHSNDTRSLEYRFRNAPHVRQRTLELLEELLALLSDSLFGEPDTHSPVKNISTAENEDEALAAEILGLETSIECQESSLYASVTDVVGRLFRVSKLAVKSTTADRHAKAETARDDKLPDIFDVAHVRDKFGNSGAETWLIERLGKAITKRRQYFLYCRKHRERLWAPSAAVAIDTRATASRPAAELQSRIQSATIVQPSSKVAASRPSNIQTTASTLDPTNLNTVDDGFDDVRSYSTVVTSVCNDAEEHALRLPKLVDVGMVGEEFECPYCYTLQKFNGERGWQKHAYTDIQPYLCTFKECGLLLFADRKTWADHEMKHHRRYWKCQICSAAVYDSRKLLEKHIKLRHKAMANLNHLDTLLDTCSYALETIPVTDCALCDWRTKLNTDEDLAGLQPEGKVTVPTARFMRHLSTHLEQLALFSLPRNDLEDVNSAAAEAGVEETSNLSGNFSRTTHSQSDRSESPRIVHASTDLHGRPAPSTDHIDRQQEETTHSISLDRLPWNDQRPKLEDRRVNEQTGTWLQLLDRFEVNVNNEPMFHCVFHDNPEPDLFERHHTPTSDIAELKRFHTQHGLHYCDRCLNLFAPLELHSHERNGCQQFRCLKPACRKYGPTFDATYCPEDGGHENSVSDIYDWLRNLVRGRKVLPMQPIESSGKIVNAKPEAYPKWVWNDSRNTRFLPGESDLAIDEVSGYAGMFHESSDIDSSAGPNNGDSVEADNQTIPGEANIPAFFHEAVESGSHLTGLETGDADEIVYRDPGAPRIPYAPPLSDTLYFSLSDNDIAAPLKQRLSNATNSSKEYLCYNADCQRSIPGGGFQRRDNMIDHMRRVHKYLDDGVERLVRAATYQQDVGKATEGAPDPQESVLRDPQEMNDIEPAKFSKASLERFPYDCNICGERFSLVEDFLRHSNSHSDLAWGQEAAPVPRDSNTADWIKLSSRHPLYGLTGDDSLDRSEEIGNSFHPLTPSVSATTHVDPSPYVENESANTSVPQPQAKFNPSDYVSKEVGPNARKTFQIGQMSFGAGFWKYTLRDITDGTPWNDNKWYPENLLTYEPTSSSLDMQYSNAANVPAFTAISLGEASTSDVPNSAASLIASKPNEAAQASIDGRSVRHPAMGDLDRPVLQFDANKNVREDQGKLIATFDQVMPFLSQLQKRNDPLQSTPPLVVQPEVNNILRTPETPKQKHVSRHSQAKPDMLHGFDCVFNNNPEPDRFHRHRERRFRYLSKLRRYHERHGLFYCHSCLARFEHKAALKSHEPLRDSCRTYRCVKPSCENYGTVVDAECPGHGRVNSPEDIHEWLRRLARDLNEANTVADTNLKAEHDNRSTYANYGGSSSEDELHPSVEHASEYTLSDSEGRRTWQDRYPESALIRADPPQDKKDDRTNSTTPQDGSQAAQNQDYDSGISSTEPDSKREGQETAVSSSHPPRSRQHDGGIGCFICGMLFENGMDLSRHQNSVHQDGYPGDDVDFEY